ncbi:MAG: co-chaperone GroES [Acutalibacteraceae bacterium]|nr:co-chaperone GroES [Acutalibacteraceae bacterium]
MKVEEIYNLKPLNNKVILKQNKITTSSTGIILIADTAEKETFCEVIASDSDLVNKGDTVYADPYVGIKLLEDDDALYVLVDESDILAIKETDK